MAIVHVAFKSSSAAPPAAAHADYIARAGRYEERGGIELLESGNMPEFAQDAPRSFWVAADAHERSNGRTYTEIQLSLPRELTPTQRETLARDVTRELLGDRFAYTMALHVPVAKDKLDQPHLHLMFSERAIDDVTRTLPEERFFKRNGAKKDAAWNDRNKPDEVREKWVEMMNRALESADIKQQLDARSWADQGRPDLAALVEPKLLAGKGKDSSQRETEVEELRLKRRELPAPFVQHEDHPARPLVDVEAIIAQREKQLEKEITRLEKECEEKNSILEKMLEGMRETARAVKQWGAEVADNITKRIEPLFGFKESVVPAVVNPQEGGELAMHPLVQTAARENHAVSEDPAGQHGKEAVQPAVMSASAPNTPMPDLTSAVIAGAVPSGEPELAQMESVTPNEPPNVSIREQMRTESAAMYAARDLEAKRKAAEAATPAPAPAAQPPSVAKPAVSPRAAVPKRHPAEIALIEHLKNDPQAQAFLTKLPVYAKLDPETARDVFDRMEGGGLLYQPGLGQRWKATKEETATLDETKKTANASLARALKANKGFFGQKKDTPEITQLKLHIVKLDRDLAANSKAIKSFEERWKVEELNCQRQADSFNAKIDQAKRFMPFIEAGKTYLDQERKRKREQQQEIKLTRGRAPMQKDNSRGR